jgi:transcription elongation factor S-II
MSSHNRLHEFIDLRKVLESDDTSRQLDALSLLTDFIVSREILKDSGIAKTVGRLREKSDSAEVKEAAKDLVNTWKKILTDNEGSGHHNHQDAASRSHASAGCNAEEDLTTIQQVTKTGNPKRDKVLVLLFDALRPRTDPDEKEPAEVGATMERHCWEVLGRDEKEYYAQIRSLRFNLTDAKNPDFRRKCLTGYFGEGRWAKLKAEDMASVAWNAQREKIRTAALEECQSDWLMRHGGIQASGMFQCGKCKGNKTTYFQMQTRSADEPMTTFVTCLVCKNKWKFC